MVKVRLVLPAKPAMIVKLPSNLPLLAFMSELLEANGEDSPIVQAEVATGHPTEGGGEPIKGKELLHKVLLLLLNPTKRGHIS